MKTFLPVMSMVIVVISDNDDDDYEEDFGQSHRQIYNIYIYIYFWRWCHPLPIIPLILGGSCKYQYGSRR